MFNEPTSGLDPATELRVLRAVLGWAKGRTVVWALGRADLAREFDRVLVLDDGRLIEQGTFAELEKQGGALPMLALRTPRRPLRGVAGSAAGAEGSARYVTALAAKPFRARQRYGSAASRRPSPKKLKARMTTMTGTTGSISQG